MSDKPNFFEELIARRIPQIIGMYIAGVWLSVEIADWMSERFGMFEQFSSYVFIGLLTFIPSVVLLAWGHGRPGKDKWSRYELAWLPLNIVLAVLAVNQIDSSKQVNISQPKNVISAPIQAGISHSVVFDSESQKISHNNVLSFFWENKTNNKEFNWLSYASSWLFVQDLKRTPDITAITPYDSQSVFNELLNKGFPTALNIPLALAIQIANKESKQWVVMGSFAYNEEEKDSIVFEAKLYNVKTGSVETTYSSFKQDQLASLDEISNFIGDFLLKSNNNSNIIPDYAIADHTSNNLAAIKTLIEAKNSIAFDNDYVKAIELIESAINQDESFAEAMVLAAKYYRAQGDFENATKYSKLALNLDYKIYKESVYELKANLFDMSGQQNKALLVLESWAEMFPTSPLAHVTLANKYLLGDNTLDKAEEQFEKLLTIENSNQNTLISLGQIYRVQGEKEKTLEVLKQYLASNPEKVPAYMELANAYKQFGMFDEAIEMYQQASILGSENYEAEIGTASTFATQGNYIKGLSLLDELLVEDNTDNQNLMLHNQKLLIFMQTGQIDNAIDELELMKNPAKKILAPLNYILSIDGTNVHLLTLQGKYSEALEYIKVIQENTKPPFNNIVMVLNVRTYLSMQDKENFEKELLAFEQFLESYPMPMYKPFIYYWKAKISYWNGDFKKSLAQLDMAIDSSKQSIINLLTNNVVDQFIYSKAEIMYELGNNGDASKEIDLLLIRNPLYADAHLLNAKIYQSQNETENAELSIQKAKDIWKDADENFISLQKLAEF